MSYETMPIVGARFRQPAPILIEALGIGTNLMLLAEPSNPYDVNAVAVYLCSEDIPSSAHAFLEENLPNCGSSLEMVLTQEQWHLGYIPKELAYRLRHEDVVGDTEPVAGTFATNADGAPRFRFSEPVL